MRIMQDLIYWASRIFAARPVHFRLRGYFVPVAHDADGRTTYIDWPEYMDSHDANQGGW